MMFPQPNIWQFRSLKICRTAFLDYIKFVNLQISKLQNCEMKGQAASSNSAYNTKKAEPVCVTVHLIDQL